MKGTFHCTQCAAERAADSTFCSNCGHSNALAKAGISEQWTLEPEPDSAPASPPLKANRPRARNFIARHWRGDYSLGIAYWVCGTLITAITLAFAVAFRSVVEAQDLSAATLGSLNLSFYGFCLLLSIWQIVGVLRSASYHVARGGKKFWSVVAALMVGIAALRLLASFVGDGIPIIRDSLNLIRGTDDIPPYSLRLLRNNTELELAGGIPVGTAEAVRKMLDGAPAVRVIHLNSIGGRVSEGDKLARIIAQRQLITYTRTQCASACAVAFLAGRERYIGEQGKIGFHSASVNGVKGSNSLNLNASFKKALYGVGASHAFVEQAINTSPEEIWYPAPNELKKQHIITAVVDSRHFALSGLSQWQDAEVVEQMLLKTPLYQTLATYDKVAYGKLQKVLLEGVQNGRSMGEIQEQMQTLIADALLPHYMPHAPDQVLLRYWRSQIAELKFFNRTNPSYCMTYLGLDNQTPKGDLIAALPQELTSEDLAALTELIKETATSPVETLPLTTYAAELQTVVSTMTAMDSGAEAVVSNPTKFATQPGRVCTNMILLYDNILSLKNQKRAAGLLRAMVQDDS
ncbi:hypothetical protein ACVW0Y_003545 [Pseudomonas sp. TE3786]